MKHLSFRKIIFLGCLTLSLLAIHVKAGSLPPLRKASHKKADESRIRSLLSDQPVEFLENKGQIRDMANNPAPYILFKAEAPGVDLYVTEKGLSYVFLESEEEEENERAPVLKFGKERHEEKIKISYERVDVELSGAIIKKENIIKEDASVADFNYLYGPGSQTIQHVKKYRKVTIKNIYPGIDWVLYNSNKSGFKYDFIVHPGASAGQIELVYRSKKDLIMNQEGCLLLGVRNGNLVENAPYSYMADSKDKVNSRFERVSSFKKGGLYENHVRFALTPSTTMISDLVIDPQLVWSTFYGGNSSEGVYCADTDPAGNLFLCGYGSSTNFPLQNAGTYYQTAASGGYLLKFNNSGTLLWSTFFGSPGVASGPFVPPSTTRFMATDNTGNVFLCGIIASGVLPTVNAGTYFQGSSGGSLDAYIAKFSNTGICLWSTYYGGGNTDEATGLATDKYGNVFLTGTTQSTNFPVQNNSTYFEPTITGSNSGFIVKFDNSGNRLWGTYLKGCNSPKVTTDGSGNVYLTGVTNTMIPLLNPGGTAFYQGSIAGTIDPYILKFNNNGVHLWGTYYGGTNNTSVISDAGTSIVTDKSRNVFVTGITTSTNFPVQNPGSGAYFQNTYTGTGNDMFILKFDSTGTRLWGTLFGGSRNDAPTESDNLTVDTCGNIWMGFNTDSRNLLFQQPCNGGMFDNSRDTSVSSIYSNVFLSRFSNNGNLLWSSYFAGDGDSHRCTWAADKLGNIFVSGEFNAVTNAMTYPTVNAGGTTYYSGYTGGDDLFVAKFSNGPNTPQSFTYNNLCSGDTTSQLPMTQSGFASGGTFSASPTLSIDLSSGRIYPSSASPGSYTISYINSGCDCPGAPSIVLGTATLSILPSPAISVSANKTTLCVNEQVILTASGANSYTWNTGPITPALTFTPTTAGPLNYSVTATGSNGCVAFGAITISVLPSPTLSISATKTVLCVNEQATLTASGASSYTWNTGLATPALTLAPTTAGALHYTVTGAGNNGCVAFETVSIAVLPAPTLSIASNKTILCVNEQATLTASGANSYTWSTGLTTSTLTVTPNIAGTLNYTVTGTGSNGCKTQKTYSISASKCTGIDELLFGDSRLGIFPNPNAGEFTITSDTDISFSLVNELGQIIKQIELSVKNERRVLIEGLSNGIYFLKDKSDVVNPKYKIVVTR